jgi:hypothetical protein
MTNPIALLTASLVLATAAGCDQGHGFLAGDFLEVADCARLGELTRIEPFELELQFLSVQAASGATVMRMSPHAARADLADQLGISITKDAELKLATRASQRTFELRADGTGEAELTLALMDRCRHVNTPLVAVGTITFEAWGWKNGEPVRGSMAFDVVDRRTGALVGTNFVGDFDFESLTGSPYTPFAPIEY